MIILLHADAVPKKRGPKTDVLEALLKRVDGLEAKLKEKKEKPGTSTADIAPASPVSTSVPAGSAMSEVESPSEKQPDAETIEVKTQAMQPVVDTTHAVEVTETAVYTPSSSR